MRYLVHSLLEASAQAHPGTPAVIDGDRSLTYAEFDARANQLANRLIAEGVMRGDRVALYLDKSLEALLAIYAVLKTGAAYVPLDPQAPIARLAYIASDAGARVLLSAPPKAESWEELRAAAPDIGMLLSLGDPETEAQLDFESKSSPAVAAIGDDLAYILYTSGSTGTPKGVMLSHRNCLAFVEWAVEEFGVTTDDRLSSHAPLHFDLSTFDLYGAALAGATLVLVPKETSVFPSQVRDFIAGQRISVWYSVPSILTMLSLRGGLTPEALPGLRVILFAGEVFPTPHLRRLRAQLPEVRFANLYGPTETNVCTWYEVAQLSPDSDDPIPIGRAIGGVEVFSVTDAGTRGGVGEVGELYVRGPTVMQGYLGDPERTAARLVPHPFGEVVRSPVDRTGDLVELQEDGDYRFLGRIDEQIKSRGYRIELGDIEAAIYSHPAVDEAAVVAIPDDLVTNRLLAFATTSEPLTAHELSRFLADRIPQYMIPERIEFHEQLPRTSTGKVDRRKLATDAGAS